MADKPKVALYWCASCGGCEEAVVDLAEGILDVVAAVDIVFWPVAMDFKRSDVEAMPDKSITVSFINGAVRTSEQEEMVHLLRNKSVLVIAYGACASWGGIPGLANLYDKEKMMDIVYDDTASTLNPNGTRPLTLYKDEAGREVDLPELYNTVRPLDQVIDVDYYIPGCPPTPGVTSDAITALLSALKTGEFPPKGTTLAPDVALCEDCERKESKPEKIEIAKFYRPHQIEADPKKCFLAQGIPCMGIATRKGCNNPPLCISGNMPCTGCFGPTSRISDYGAKLLSAITSEVEAKDDEGIAKTLEGIPDPTGTFYRYSLATSLLRRRINDTKGA